MSEDMRDCIRRWGKAGVMVAVRLRDELDTLTQAEREAVIRALDAVRELSEQVNA